MSFPTAATKTRLVTRLRDGHLIELEDTLVVEEPLEIRLGNERFTVTMRTPGSDFELTRGLLLTEGVIESEADIGQIRYCDTGEASESEIPNIVTVRLNKMPAADRLWQRTLMAGTSCGLCGKAALDAVAMQTCPLPLPTSGTLSQRTLLELPHTLRRQQELFKMTGGLHAVGLFAASGECLCAFEDIGRHNATDKAIGYGVQQGWLPWTNPEPLILLVSGRASFEITQKALMARIPVVCSVSAASSLAADLAELNNQTLVGFLRDTGMTIYAGNERITHLVSFLADPPETGR
ncbi:MAG: formate dehydrogenase accessory sulfurtransferase FdhD [Janthinobacterium lividum]